MPASGPDSSEKLSYTNLQHLSLSDTFCKTVDGEMPFDVKMYSNESNSENRSPYLQIIVEPEKTFRYRYKSEKGFHGGIHGNTPVRLKKSFPVVQLENFVQNRSVPIVVKASLFMDEPTNPQPHVLELIGKTCENGVSYAVLGKDKKASFPSIAIGHKKREEVKEELMRKEILKYKTKRQKFNERQIEADIKEFIKNINLKSARLGFQAFYKDDLENPLCETVFSQAISDSRGVSTGDMNIIRISSYTGKCTGGEEIILLCNKIKKEDIEIRFYETDGNLIGSGTFSPADVHHQVAITFKTPRYEKNVENIVQMCLYQPSDDKIGIPIEFRYIVDDENEMARKKRKHNSMENSITTAETWEPSTVFQPEDIYQDTNLEVNSPLEELDLYLQSSCQAFQQNEEFKPVFQDNISSDNTSYSSSLDDNYASFTEPDSTTDNIILQFLNSPDISGETMNFCTFGDSSDESQSELNYFNNELATGTLKLDGIVGQALELTSFPVHIKNPGSTESHTITDYTHNLSMGILENNTIVQNVKKVDLVSKPIVEGQMADARSPLSKVFTSVLKTDSVIGQRTSLPAHHKTLGSTENIKLIDHTPNLSSGSLGNNPIIREAESVPEPSLKDIPVGEMFDSASLPPGLKELMAKFRRSSNPSFEITQPREKHKQKTLRDYICEHLHIELDKTNNLPDSVCATDKNGNNFLHLMALKDKQDITLYRLFLENASVNAINQENKCKETPLHLAVQQDNWQYTALLLKYGAKVNAVNEKGSNCFHFAAKNNCVMCLKILLHLCKRKTWQNHCQVMNALNYDGWSPLHLAIVNNSRECTEQLLKGKADINLSEKRCGRTPLHLAIEFQPTLICQLLSRPDLDLDAVDFRGYSPLQFACHLKGLSFERVRKHLGEDLNLVLQFLKDLSNEKLLQCWKLRDDELHDTYSSSTEDSCSDLDEEDRNEIFYDCNETIENERNFDFYGNSSRTHDCVEKKLCKLLDTSDWRKLGKAIGLTKMEMDRIEELNEGLSPTKTVLKHIKEVHAGHNLETIISVLNKYLLSAGLSEAAQLIQDNR